MRDITEKCVINPNVYNGQTLADMVNEDFMTEVNVAKIMKGLKIKNCEGFDRIPLRILNEGAEYLIKPIAKLMQLIYSRKTIPEQWRIAKVIPTHKSGKRDNVANYRPISNLCTMSKVYEKLILGQLLKISEENGFDLTGTKQHGFKSNRSTVTAGLAMQSLISRAIDNDEYYILGSLDLSAAFDVVNRDLLFERMSIMGLPQDVISLIKDWQTDRMLYLEHNKSIKNKQKHLPLSVCTEI